MRILWRNVLPAKSHDAVRLHSDVQRTPPVPGGGERWDSERGEGGAMESGGGGLAASLRYKLGRSPTDWTGRIVDRSTCIGGRTRRCHFRRPVGWKSAFG